MRRLVLATALLFPAGTLVAGCFDSSAVEHPNGSECGYEPGAGFDPQVDSAAACAGEVCLVLSTNQQNMRGICSQDCNVDADCTLHERCVTVPLSTSTQGNFCFRACKEDSDCYDSFVCRLLTVGNNTRFCIVDPA